MSQDATGTPFEELNLGNPALTDEQLLDAIEAHPILLNRPFVITSRGRRLCRTLKPDSSRRKTARLWWMGRESALASLADLPNLRADVFQLPDPSRLAGPRSTHPPRVLLLYGSLRERSYSRLLTEEAARLLNALGAETRIFDPRDLPLPDSMPADHPKVQELRDLSLWSEAHVWCSPERHGAISGIMKAQIDWIPLEIGSVRPTQGRTLAVMQVCGGSQSFNAVNTLRLLGRWMRMITIPNQSSVAKAYQEFDDAGRMKPSAYYERVVDVMEELVKFTLLTRDIAGYLVDRYSERKEGAAKPEERVNLKSI
jgi:arsenic resistance protein ArsH